MTQHPTDVGHVYEVWRSTWEKNKPTNEQKRLHRLLIVCIYVCIGTDRV